MTYASRLEQSIESTNTCLCLGLDPRVELLPEGVERDPDSILEFCKSIVEVTYRDVCAYKPNHAFFAAHGLEDELADLIEFIHRQEIDIPVILDAKRGDIGSTAEYYAIEVFERYDADAVTVSPFLGWDTVEPFLEHRDRGVYVLCRTSNPGSSWLQDQSVDEPIYQQIAEQVDSLDNPNLGLVAGATHIEALEEIRSYAPNALLLVPGVGEQGAAAESIVEKARADTKFGLVVNVSRSIIHHDASESYLEKIASRAMEFARQLAIPS